jgi:uncharacterized RDD family membrane protein YckC
MTKNMLIRRLVAFMIDMTVAYGGMMLLWCYGPGANPEYLMYPSIRMALTGAYWLGWLWLIGYGLLKDCLFVRRSLGKLCTGLKVIDMQSQAKVSYKQLILRNITFPIMQVECVVVLILRGKRLGDMVAKTKVVDRRL